MKKKVNFLQSSEKYLWKTINRAGASLPFLITLLLIGVITSSLLTKNVSLAGAESVRDAVERALGVGDYERARELWEEQNKRGKNKQVLGVESELEQKLYPEIQVEARIEELKELLRAFEGHRDILLEIARLYRELGRTELSNEYWEQARILDPNNEIFKK